MMLPKPPLTRPSILAGHRNGLLPAALLEPTTFGAALAVRPAARAFRAFAAVEARPRGHDPRNVGGYRDLAGQWQIFGGTRARYRPATRAEYDATPADRRKLWRPARRRLVILELAALGYRNVPDVDYWVKIKGPAGYPATAACPGESNHGDGLAIDVAEQLDTDPAAEPLSAGLLSLLVTRGGLYGLGAELDAEPWHWRYYAGDAIPSAVLAYEHHAATTGDPLVPAPTFRYGTRGENVRQFQQAHNAHRAAGRDHGPQLAEDGIDGRATDAVVRSWQRFLNVDDDGIYGPITAARFRAYVYDLERSAA